ncbi:unnamed protein product [Plutella xylostella]|uniref:(diamondback moth) hypothetical protein n=1 Tax=Plutella xylostella TaxID=51655 RepID=A0A8S4EG71_PLUXY|nr:unnamed protein product [Plutella xylostella]
MWTCVGVLLAIVGPTLAITRDQFYPFGRGQDLELPRGAEVASPEIALKVPIRFYGETYETLFVNNFGVVSFRADIQQFLNSEFPLPYPSVAAFYTNIDTSIVGNVYYRETNDPHIILKAEESIQTNFHEYFDFHPTSVFIATWIDVTYSGNQDKKNSFQLALISNGTESFVELLYPEREIQWIQKEPLPGALPDAKAQAGFVAEDGRVYTLRGSGTHQVRNIMSWSNVHEPGKYVFRVGEIQPEGNIAAPDNYNQYDLEAEDEYKTCAQSGASMCHFEARCVDYQAGICCKCNEGFYGNGKSCIKDNVPLRAHGKLNGVINNVDLNDVDIQAYIVVGDGRSYTALTQAPVHLGNSLQLLNILGGPMGWLFAKPQGSAKNGYQLTGALLNYSAEIYFPASNDKVSVSQEFLGHDVFDQITVESDVRGTIPFIGGDNTKLDVSEYEEQYSIVESGLIRSESNRTFVNKRTGEKYEQRISQIFSFNEPCRYEPPTEDSNTPITLKVSKSLISYESRDNIVRYAMSNKVVPLGQDDPCIVGRASCGLHSTCVVQGNSFTCVCPSGFTQSYEGSMVNCVDINECTTNTHNCDVNAECYNHEGGFRCVCRSDYKGDGVNCVEATSCEESCDPNAQCVFSPLNTFVCQCNPGYVGDGNYCTEIRSTTAASSVAEADYNQTFVLPHCSNDECICPPGYSNYVDENVPNTKLCRLDYEPEQTTRDQSGPGIRCETDEDCPPHAACSGNLECACLEGYEGDGYECIERSYDSKCVCGANAGCVDTGAGDTICVCNPGYQGDGIVCRPNYVCLNDTDCTNNSECRYEHTLQDYICQCIDGYTKDQNEQCVPIGTSCDGTVCAAAATCLFDTAIGIHYCQCNMGYHGDGYVCQPNFGCTNNSDCELNAECRPDALNNEYVCQCVEGYTKDQNDACILDGLSCDGAICARHASCLFDDTIGIHYCHCDQGYEGEGIISCTQLEHTCAIDNDCSVDGICTKNEYGYECVCREGFIGDGYTCNEEQTCRNNPYLCDTHASCLKRNGVYVCECNSGYLGNGSSCELKPSQPGNFLVASDGMIIYRIPFHITAGDYATPINTAIDQIAVSIDVDCQAGRVYWSDIVSNTIKRAAYDGSNLETFIANDVKAEGISIDWSARNIFWTNPSKHSIEVANLDTKIRKTLFSDPSIANPRGIVVHPQRGKVFWSDWNRQAPKIEWASMDGSQRGLFLAAPDVKLPNSLAIDWATDRLCFSDAGLKTLECVSIDTRIRETVATDCSYPFGLAINKERFYWTDWRTLRIEYIDEGTRVKGHLPVTVASRKLYGVAIAPEQCSTASNVCQYRNGNCEYNELCLPDGNGSRTCVPGL